MASNTDADAVVEAVGAANIAGKRILVLGAGGAARAAACGLAFAGGSVVIANRTSSRATRVAEELATAQDDFPALDVHAQSLASLATQQFDVIVNCTSAGMQGGEARSENPLPCGVKLDERTIVMDAVYTPAQTPLLIHAASCGSVCVTGEAMFLAQARRQFELWTGSPPPSSL